MSPAEKTVLLTYAPAMFAAVAALGLDAYGRRAIALWTAVAGVGVSAVMAGFSVFGSSSGNAWGVLAVGAGFSAVPAVVFVLASAALAGGADWFSGRPHGGSWAALIVFAACGSGAAATSLNLIALLIALEIVAAASYALVTSARSDRADESAMKYFIQGAVVTGIFVFSLAPLVALFAPDASYATLERALAQTDLVTPALLGGMLLTASLAFKSGSVPFHSWAPDAYETAPPVVVAFIATGPKLAGIGALGVMWVAFSGSTVGGRLSAVLAVLALLSVLVGSIAALGQRGYTRMLGYAGIAQVGYALVALAAGYPPAALLFTTTYAVGSAGTFLAAEAFHRTDPEWDGTIRGLAGMGKRAPLVSLGVAASLVSLAGVPPLLGFWGKFWAFGAAVQNGYLWLALVAIAGSVVSVAYYGSVLRAIYIDEYVLPERPDDSDVTISAVHADPGLSRDTGSAGKAVVVLGALSVLTGVAPLVLGISTLLLPFILQ